MMCRGRRLERGDTSRMLAILAALPVAQLAMNASNRRCALHIECPSQLDSEDRSFDAT